MKRLWLTVALLITPVLLTSGCLGLYLLVQPPPPQACAPGGTGSGTQVDVDQLPAGPVAGWSGAQLRNAALVMNAAQALGLDTQAQTLGVMVAMGESSLTVLNRGDAVGPDSRGLFQQRANGAWGSYADRMDPTTSATNFFRALVAVPGWAQLEPTIAAHRTQRNADPYYYARFWPQAQQVVAALTGRADAGESTSATTEVTGTLAPAPGCADGDGAAADLQVAPGSWAKPAVGPLTSGYGTRRHPVTGVIRQHTGDDISAACGSTIYAAAAGRVITAGPARGYGHLIAVDHGGGVVTRYGHMYADGVDVHVGDTVAAGQVIGQVGSDGVSTGCHLHFEVQRDGAFVDPAPFMASQGAGLA